MSLAREIRRGAALNARFAVNGSQKASRSLGTAVARCAASDGMARSPFSCAYSTLRAKAFPWITAPSLAAARGGCYHALTRQCRIIMADKPDKTNKLKARLTRGFADRGGAEIAATRRMLDKIRAVYERYGFGCMWHVSATIGPVSAIERAIVCMRM